MEEEEDDEHLPQPTQQPPQAQQCEQRREAVLSASEIKQPESAEPPQEHLSPITDTGTTATTDAVAPNADAVPNLNAKKIDCNLPLEQVLAALGPCVAAAESKVTEALQQRVACVESQILRALQQAAFDIIEHLGKEAAARVVVAERKAAFFQQELSNAKRQGLSMLLHLKSSTDDQIKAAEKKYLIERRKAQDAEAKLVAAQDTAKRLKSELRRKDEILEKMQKVAHPAVGKQLEQFSGLRDGAECKRIWWRGKVIGTRSKLQPAEAETLLPSNLIDDNNDTTKRPKKVLQYDASAINVKPMLPSAVQVHNTIVETNTEKWNSQPLEQIEQKQLISQVFGGEMGFNGKPKKRSGGVATGVFSLRRESILQDVGVDREKRFSKAIGTEEEQFRTEDSSMMRQGKGSSICNTMVGDTNHSRQMHHADAGSPIASSCLKVEHEQACQHEKSDDIKRIRSRDGSNETVASTFPITTRGLPYACQSPIFHNFKIPCQDHQENMTCLSHPAERVSEVTETCGMNGHVQVISMEEQSKPSADMGVYVDAVTISASVHLQEAGRSDVQSSCPILDLCETSGSCMQLATVAQKMTDVTELSQETRMFNYTAEELQVAVESGSTDPDKNFVLFQSTSDFVREGVSHASLSTSEPIKGKKEELREDIAIGDQAGSAILFHAPDHAPHVSQSMDVLTVPEVVRSDYEVATSLAELCVIAAKDGQDFTNVLPLNLAGQDLVNSQSTLVLRRKRKGIPTEQQEKLGAEEKLTKRPRRESKEWRRPLKNHVGKMATKARDGASVSHKANNHAVESTRDNRRLMQGARQLFSLSEKKWH